MLTAKEAFKLSEDAAETIEVRKWLDPFKIDELSLESILKAIRVSASEGYFTCHIETNSIISNSILRRLLAFGYTMTSTYKPESNHIVIAW